MRTSDTRSFSAGVKEELIRLPLGKPCCMLSEISALTQTSGHLSFRGGGWISVSYRLDRSAPSHDAPVLPPGFPAWCFSGCGNDDQS